MSDMYKKKFPSRKKQQVEARKKALHQKDAPTIAESATTDDIERLLKRINMEITFADDSTINKEIVISSKEISDTPKAAPPEASPPEEAKIPWVTVAVLAFIICASLITGIIHWYRAYYLPADAVVPGHVMTEPGGAPGINAGQTRGDETIVQPQDVDHDVERDPDPDSLETGPHNTFDPTERSRYYAIEPLPEFLLLWDEYGNEDIVAVLTIGETEIPVVQSNNNAFYITHDINRNLSALGWVFLDYQVDLFVAMEHNMVLYDPAGEFLRPVMLEFADYDFFLRNPLISLSTLFGEIEWEIFSYYIAPSDFPFAVVNHPDDYIWGEMVEQFTMASLYNTMLDVNMHDQVLTIVVPTTVNPELFYILQARMLRQITS